MPLEISSVGRDLVVAVSVLVMVLVAAVNGFDTKEFQKGLPARVVWAIPGRNVELPCDITPALPGDNVSMIFWFKDQLIMPLYTLDARRGPLNQASHLATSNDLGARSYFITEEEPSKARLRIQTVSTHDQGVFRCRVDFVNSPTRNFQINLTLVVQPSQPKIFDTVGKELRVNQPAGPFLEGKELFLSCQVTGGNPKPSVTWWFNNTILDGVIDSSRSSHTTVNQLSIRNTPRNFKGAKLECRATSAEEAGYNSRLVPLIVFLKPTKVKIVTPNDLLSIRKAQNMKCETSGSYPPAKLTWSLGGKPIRNAIVTVEETESFTGSVLSLNVTVDDDGKDLVCRADNPRFPGGSAEDRRQIHVAYSPKVTVKLDSESEFPIKEGSEVKLNCEISARPSASSFSWFFNGHLIPFNETAGIMPMEKILVIKRIERSFAGQYACSAINTEGETYSAPYDLEIQYPPRCRKGLETMRVGGLPYETIVVQCSVDAVPEVTRFSWTFNTSRGVFAVQSDKISNRGDTSMLQFTPSTDDVESLSCWASNSVGQQEKPCTFHIIPAEAPETPKSCLVRNASHGEGLEVSCIAGKDGGLHQSFVLEVSDVTMPSLPPSVTTLSDQGEMGPPIYRVLGERPVFHLHSLQPGKQYQVAVYAENAKGRSNPPVILPNVRVETDGPPDYQGQEPSSDAPSSQYSNANKNMTVIIIIGAVTAVIVLTSVVIVTVIACRKPQAVEKRARRSSKPPEEFDLSEAGFGEGFHRRSAQYRASMYGECEERISRMIEGPDLIMAPVSLSQEDLDF